MREQACADVQLAYAFIFHICENKDYLMKRPYLQDSGICGHASDNRQGVNSITIITVLIVHRIVLFGPGSLLPRWRTEKQERGRCQLFIIYKCYSELFSSIDRTCERNIDFLN